MLTAKWTAYGQVPSSWLFCLLQAFGRQRRPKCSVLRQVSLNRTQLQSLTVALPQHWDLCHASQGMLVGFQTFSKRILIMLGVIFCGLLHRAAVVITELLVPKALQLICPEHNLKVSLKSTY